MADSSDVNAAESEVDPDEAPSFLARSSGLLLGGGLVASAIAHLTLGGVVLFASPKLFATVPEQTMTIDIVTPEELAQTAKDEPPQPTPEKVDPPPLTFPEITPLPQQQQAQQQQAQQQQAQQQQQIQQPRQKMAAAPPTPPASPPIAATAPPQAPPPSAAPQSQLPVVAPAPQGDQSLPDPATVAELLHMVAPAQATGSAPPTENKARLSAQEVIAFKDHLKQCWMPPTGIPEGEPLKTVVRIALNPGGRFTAQPDLLVAPASTHGPALVQSVMSALAQCQPYNVLPADKYQEWKLLDLTFSQNDLAINPVSSKGKGGPKS
jgi:hypothetical protein